MQNKPKFEIGDKVRVVVEREDSKWDSAHHNGEIGTIISTQVEPNERLVAYWVLVGKLEQCHPDYELELISLEPKNS